MGRTVADSAGAWSLTVATANALTDGGYSITAKQIDAAGNASGASSEHRITVDTTAPTLAPRAPVLSSASDSGASNSDGITNDTTPTFTGTGAEASSIVALFAGTREIGRSVADSGGAWSITVAAADALANGTHAITVKQIDTAGNAGPASPVTQLVIDTVGPTVTGFTTSRSLREFELAFNEAIVFSPSGEFKLMESTAIKQSYVGSNSFAGSNWSVKTDVHGVASLLNFKISLNGLFNMHMANDSVQDLAGNVAIIGTPQWLVDLSTAV
jgi:hypothetical protein